MYEESRILFSLRRALRPILRVLMRAGISIRPIINTLRLAIVEAAILDLEETKSTINNSVISRMTGIDRRDIGQIREFLAKESHPSTLERSDELAEVLSLWANTDDFLDSQGKPEVLNTSVDSPSFVDLVSRAGATQTPEGILRRLLDADSVELIDNAKVRLVSRGRNVSRDLAVLLTETVETSASTLPINYGRTEGIGVPQKVTFVYPPNLEATELIRRIAKQKITSFIEELDNQLVTLMMRFADDADEQDRTKRVGVAVSYFEIDP